MQRAVEEHPTSAFIKGSVADLTLKIITSKSTTSARACKPKWKTKLKIKTETEMKTENCKSTLVVFAGLSWISFATRYSKWWTGCGTYRGNKKLQKLERELERVEAPNEQRRTTKAAVLPGCKRSGRSRRR
jgi:hypothetical protein